MKKILFASAAVLFLAAGCNKAPAASPADNGSVQQPAGGQSSSAAQQVNGADDAVNLLNSESANEQSIVAGTDDSSIVNSDAADFDSLTEVPNGN